MLVYAQTDNIHFENTYAFFLGPSSRADVSDIEVVARPVTVELIFKFSLFTIVYKMGFPRTGGC